ncbi:MAG: MATE family efflux transporter [Bacteroidia bacterium]|nr:MATE family efflux transporter [Bacteroidia bacterium]
MNSYRDIVISIGKLAFPITMGQLGLVLMGFSDVVMLGKYNTLAMSSAGFGNAVFFLFMLLGIGTMYAVSTLTSIADGENMPQQAIPIFKSSNWVAFYLSIALMALNYLVIDNIHIFKQSAELSRLGKDYIKIVNLSVPALLFFNSGKQILDGLGKTQISMYITFFGLLMNVGLNYCFIYGHLGFSEMGLQGAAWATVITRFAMAIIQMIWTWWHPLIRTLRVQTNIQVRSYVLEILKVGLPVGFTFFFEIAAFSIALIFAGQISDLHSGAHQIAINLASITYMFVTGFSAAGNIIVGNHFGAADAAGIRRSGLATLILTITIEVFFALIFLVFYKQLPTIYTKDIQLMEMTYPLILLAALFQLSDGLQTVGAGILRGIKDTMATGIIAFVSYWIIMTPGAYILCFHYKLGLPGIWIAFVVGLSFAAVLLIYRFMRLTSPARINRLIEKQMKEDHITPQTSN